MSADSPNASRPSHGHHVAEFAVTAATVLNVLGQVDRPAALMPPTERTQELSEQVGHQDAKRREDERDRLWTLGDALRAPDVVDDATRTRSER
jgi:hypothetical protein